MTLSNHSNQVIEFYDIMDSSNIEEAVNDNANEFHEMIDKNDILITSSFIIGL